MSQLVFRAQFIGPVVGMTRRNNGKYRESTDECNGNRNNINDNDTEARNLNHRTLKITFYAQHINLPFHLLREFGGKKAQFMISQIVWEFQITSSPICQRSLE